jgi:hypothetical protein
MRLDAIQWLRDRRRLPAGERDSGQVVATPSSLSNVETPWWPEHVGIDSEGYPMVVPGEVEDAPTPSQPRNQHAFVSTVVAFPVQSQDRPFDNEVLDYMEMVIDAGVQPDGRPRWQAPVRLVFGDASTADAAMIELGRMGVIRHSDTSVDLPVRYVHIVEAASRLPAPPVRLELRWQSVEDFDALSAAALRCGLPTPVFA